MFGRVRLVFHHELLGPFVWICSICGKGYLVLHVEGGMMTSNSSFYFVIHVGSQGSLFDDDIM